MDERMRVVHAEGIQILAVRVRAHLCLYISVSLLKLKIMNGIVDSLHDWHETSQANCAFDCSQFTICVCVCVCARVCVYVQLYIYVSSLLVLMCMNRLHLRKWGCQFYAVLIVCVSVGEREKERVHLLFYFHKHWVRHSSQLIIHSLIHDLFTYGQRHHFYIITVWYHGSIKS